MVMVDVGVGWSLLLTSLAKSEAVHQFGYVGSSESGDDNLMLIRCIYSMAYIQYKLAVIH